MSWVIVAVGTAAAVGGGVMQAQGNKKQKKALEGIANTPGVDIDEIIRESLTSTEGSLGRAQGLVGKEATGRQSLVNDLMEQSMPGFTGLRDKATATADDFLDGEIPQDVSDAVQRSSAAQAIGGGFGGSGMHRNLVARDLGTTSLGLKSTGMSWLNALRGLSPTVTPQSAFNFTGPTPTQAVEVASAERSGRMNMLGQAAGVPNSMQSYGSSLSGLGGTLMGAGIASSGGFGSMGGGMGNMSSGTMRINAPAGARYPGVWSDEFI